MYDDDGGDDLGQQAINLQNKIEFLKIKNKILRMELEELRKQIAAFETKSKMNVVYPPCVVNADVFSNHSILSLGFFLGGIAIIAIGGGLWPSLLATLIGVIFYDLFFLPPIYSLAISSNQDIIYLTFIILSAILISIFVSRRDFRSHLQLALQS